MQLHNIQPTTKPHEAKRVGRGGKRGTYAGRGMKGQKSRAGAKFQPVIREFLKHYHKLRGYRGYGAPKATPVNLSALESAFKKGETVTPTALVERNVVDQVKGRAPRIKLLGTGELSKQLTIEGCMVSEPARKKIEQAGGTIVPA